jgi:hypothetical protein
MLTFATHTFLTSCRGRDFATVAGHKSIDLVGAHCPVEHNLLHTRLEPTRIQSLLAAYLADITGIKERALRTSDLRMSSIVPRMSWASRRVTTRTEDIAYCLMGIFDVNMPLLYGEGGEKAFLRLEEELLKSSVDQYLFAWGDVHAVDENKYPSPRLDGLIFRLSYSLPPPSRSLLATSPANFTRFGTVSPFHRTPDSGPLSMTSKGVRLPGLLIRHHNSPGCTVLLDCHHEGDLNGQIGIHLNRNHGSDHYSRVMVDPVFVPLKFLPNARDETIFVKDLEIFMSLRPPVPEDGHFFVFYDSVKKTIGVFMMSFALSDGKHIMAFSIQKEGRTCLWFHIHKHIQSCLFHALSSY